MTTRHSPLAQLKAQADRIAATLKAAERGEKIDVRFAEKIAEARSKESFRVGVVMDDSPQHHGGGAFGVACRSDAGGPQCRQLTQ
jgi:hypothetical protein